MLTTQTVSELSGLSFTTICDWVARRIIKPARPGRKGRGMGNLYSARQLIGITVASVLHQSERGCSPRYAGKVVAHFESFTDEEVDNWLSKSGTLPTPSFGRADAPKLPGDDYIMEEIHARLAKVEPVARAMFEEERAKKAKEKTAKRSRK